MTRVELADRYGELYEAVSELPSTATVDVERVLRTYLGHYIHEVQAAVVGNPMWELDQLQTHLSTRQQAASKVFSLSELNRGPNKEFRAAIGIVAMLGQPSRVVRVSHQTNAGMGEFEVETK
jgi:hypothetical protein